MDQTPAHEQHNTDLLAFIPKTAKKLVEVGCSSGALAREYKKINSAAHYTGIEISAAYADLAKRHCDTVLVTDIEHHTYRVLANTAGSDCWIFGDSLEHLRDPWGLLRGIRKFIDKDGSVVACIPNAQHWSIQLRLSCGEFRYEDMGLLDKTHLRWFTRLTMLEMFVSTGYKVVAGIPRIFPEPGRERFLPAIRLMAELAGANPDIAVADATPLQYVVRAVPA
jgi:2-polyprenyl-3-methyl-5-hydroxy-6-metoxy-1,4-benzoquinol methylase